MKIYHTDPFDLQIGDLAFWKPNKDLVFIVDIETEPYGYIAKVRNFHSNLSFYTPIGQLELHPSSRTTLGRILYK